MAARKFLYMAERGYPHEFEGGADTLDMQSAKLVNVASATNSGDALAYAQSGASLAGLALTGNLTMGSNSITGLAAGVNSGDAVNKGQLDQAIINGGKMKELLIHQNQLSNAEGVLSAISLTMQNQPVSGDTITITDGTTTRTYGATTGGDVQYTIGVDVATTMANLAAAITGDSSGAWDAAFTTDLDSIDSTGVVVIYETDSAATLSKIYGTWATPADVEVVNYYGKLDYSYKTLSTLPASSPANSNFGIHRATPEAGELHFVENNDTIYGWDDDADVWQVMSGTSSIPDATSASGGGIKGKITVDSDYGLSVASGVLKISVAGTNPGLEFRTGGDLGKIGVDADTAAGITVGVGGVGIQLAGTNPGLEFRTGGDAGKLGVLTDGSHGVIVGATGVELELASADRLTVGSSGLDVVGLPSLFKINGTAVGATVTAANLDDLTDGGETTLHTHPSAPEAERVENVFTTSGSVALGDPVYFTSTANTVASGDAATDAKADVFGVAKEAKATGQAIQIVTVGKVAGALTSATPGTPYYLNTTSGLKASTPPTGKVRVLQVGFAASSADLFVLIHDFGKKAA